MTAKTSRPGIALLLFAVLISSGMLMCLGAWKATTYFVDFSLEKEIYLQNCASMEGVMRAVTRALGPRMWQDEQTITLTLEQWPFVHERFKNIGVMIGVKPSGPLARAVDVTFVQERVVVGRARCMIRRKKDGEVWQTSISGWNIEA